MRLLLALTALPLAVAAAPSLPSALPAPLPLTALDTVQIKEWTVPWERSRPRDPYFDKKTGDVWFVGQVGNYVARLNPRTGAFRRYELEERALPHNLVVDEDGTVWYAGNGNGHIGKLDPETGKVTRYPMPDSAARDPHTLLFGRNGDIWFTVQGGNYVGHLVKASGQVHLIKVPTPNARPYGIVLDSKGRPWFNEFGTNKIAMVEPSTMQLREFTLPDPAARGRRIAVTPDDMVWYVDYARGFLGRLDPATSKVDEWAMPSGAQSRPYAMTVDHLGRLWAVETGVSPNQLVGFDPKAGQFFSVTKVPSSVDGNGRNVVRHMMYNPEAKEIWFGTDANTIGRASLP
jgi:virginiamycin B lyase